MSGVFVLRGKEQELNLNGEGSCCACTGGWVGGTKMSSFPEIIGRLGQDDWIQSSK